MANANIFQQYLRPPKSVMEYGADLDAEEANALALQGGRQRNELAALTMDQTRGQIADASAKRNAIQQVFAQLGPQATPIARARALQANPLTAADGVAAEKAILENEKTAAGTGKDQAAADKERIANGLQRFQIANQLMSGVRDQASYDMARQKATEFFGPEFAAKLPPVFDAGEVERGRLQAQSVAQQLEQEWKQKGYDRDIANDKEKVRQFGVTSGEQQRHNRTTEGISGGNLALARTREAREAQAPRGTYDSERGLIVDPRTGESRPVTSGGAPIGPKPAAKDGVITEGERNAGGYAMRMVEATKLLDTHEPKGRATVATEAAGAVGRNSRSLVMNADQQKYRQAQEDWVRAKLRKESGAAIPVKEMDDEIATYFPGPFETDKSVVEQKRQSREVATRAMVQAAGRGAPKADAANGFDDAAKEARYQAWKKAQGQ